MTRERSNVTWGVFNGLFLFYIILPIALFVGCTTCTVLVGTVGANPLPITDPSNGRQCNVHINQLDFALNNTKKAKIGLRKVINVQ